MLTPKMLVSEIFVVPTDTFTFEAQSGLWQGTLVDNMTVLWFEPDVNAPLWYEENPGFANLILVYGDEASGFVSDVDILAQPTISNLKYPLNMTAPSTGPAAVLLLEDMTTIAQAVPIDYAASPKAVIGLQVPVVPAMADFDLGPFDVQGWNDYDYSASIVDFTAVFLGGLIPSTGSGVTYGHLLLCITNRSGSTVTAFDSNGSGGNIIVKLPSSPDPDDPQDGEMDVSFAGGSPSCAVHDATGATVTVSGDRHTLNFKISGASILDNTRVQFVFPVEFNCGDPDEAVYGTSSYSYFVYATPALLTYPVVPTPAATTKVFMTLGSANFSIS